MPEKNKETVVEVDKINIKGCEPKTNNHAVEKRKSRMVNTAVRDYNMDDKISALSDKIVSSLNDIK